MAPKPLRPIDPITGVGDDFFGYFNWQWIRRHPVPAQLTTISNFTLLAEWNCATVRNLIEELASSAPSQGTNDRRLADAYHAFLNADAHAAAKPNRARAWLDRIWNAVDLEQLAAVTAEPGFVPLLCLEVRADPWNPQVQIGSIGPAALGLPGQALYLHDDDRSRTIRSAYRSYLSLLLERSGYPHSARLAENVVAYERAAARLHWKRELLRDPDLAWTAISLIDLTARAPAFPLAALLHAGGLASVDRLLAGQVPPAGTSAVARQRRHDGLPALMNLIADTPLATLKAYCTARFLDLHAAVLGSAIDNAWQALHDRLLRGRAKPLSRWKRAVGAVEAQLGDLLGARYIASHFTPERKAQVETLVEHIRAATRQSLLTCGWMGEKTRQQALAKLATLDVQIGYGALAETYDGLTITPDDPLANEIAAARWRQGTRMTRLGQTVDRAEWPFAPQTVNASYVENRNQIILPAGILQPPFFDPALDAASNFGAIGAIIGHEVAHGFDDQGAKYDAAGALRNWWQPDDRATFDSMIDRLVVQYASFRLLPNDEALRINGPFSRGEIIADLAGLELAYRAFHLMLDGADPPSIDGYTADQRFFIAFARLWRSSQSEAALRNQIATSPHPPAMFRVNGTVRNMDAWYNAFDVRPGMALYLPPSERVHIWTAQADLIA